jgi:DNA polymerase kappa
VHHEQLTVFKAKSDIYRRQAEALVDRRLEDLAADTAIDETWVHIDMDMFYVAVEIRDDPTLADKPVAVGGNNMVATSNYHARKFGVRSAMPGFIALKLCPELVLVPPNMAKYKAVAEQVREVFREYDPLFESMGLDEGHLGITEYIRERGLDSPEGRETVVQEIRSKVHEVTGLTCSAGIACNKLLAKICSELNKPNGQFYLPFSVEVIREFISNQFVRKIPGIGKVLEKVLNGLGIVKCQDILDRRLELSVVMSENSLNFLLRSALGQGCTQHSKAEEQKSISVSKTFKPCEDVGFLMKKLREFSESSAEEAKSISLAAMCVTVHIRTAKYEERSK